jgi:signal transduction histidine kinase
MHSNLDLSPAIRRLLRHVEWTLVAIVALNSLVNGDANLGMGMLFLSAFVGLSLIFPLHSPLWQRLSYGILGLTLVIIAYGFGVDFNIFFYLYIAKSCFLLDRKSVIILVILTALISTPVYLKALPRLQEFSGQGTYPPAEVRKLTVNYLGNYLAGSTLAIVFSSMVMAEQKSRQQAEALTQQVERMAATLERTRIARDIHDSLGHTLTSLQVQLAVAQEFRQQHLEQSFQAIDIAKRLADQCIEEVSLSLSSMRQSQFDLNLLLHSLRQQIQQNRSLRVHWEMNLPHLPASVGHHLYCIVKEGLMNIEKHAQASTIWVQGQAASEAIVLDIADDGQGFDLQMPRSGFGLTGMEERVQALHGKCIIQSQLNQGTQIQIVIPIPSALRQP